MLRSSSPAPAALRRVAALPTSALCAAAVGMLPAAAASAANSTLKSAAEATGHYFGGEIGQNLLSNSTATSLAAAQFDMITPENEMKWDTIEPSQGNFDFGPGDAIMNFAQSNGMRVRGHNLVWHSQLPGWVSNLPSNQVQAAMENHITTEVSHYKGRTYAWDVVNEPFDDGANWRGDAFYNAMGPGYVADALWTAHNADPNAKLYLNDYNIEGQNSKSDAMYNLVKSLKSQGVPIDGVGFESHFIVGQIPGDLQANMARFTALGVNVAVTELDDRMPTPAGSANLSQQATDDANVVTACLNTSGCVGVSQWAVGDADSWVPSTFGGQGAATLFDMNYQPKPAYYSVLNALGGSAPPPPPPPAGSTSLGSPTELIGAQSGRCLDTPASGGNGSQLQLWDCWGSANQTYVLNGDGSVHVENMCLDAPLGAGQGANVQVWSCSGAANQRWSWNLDGTLVSASTGLCASTSGNGTANGTPIILWQCYAGPGQQWAFNPHAVVGGGSGRCLDVPGHSTAPGARLQIWDCWSGADNQTWTRTAAGQLAVYSGGSTLCLGASGAGTSPGTPVITWTCNGSPDQQWVLNGNGTITDRLSGLCLDVAWANTANGSQLQLWTCNGGSGQQWTLR